MTEFTQEQKAQIKEIWLKKRNFKKLSLIFLEDLREFFSASSRRSPEFIQLMNMVRGWKKEEKEKDVVRLTKGIPDEEALKIQNENRKRTIILLSKLLEKYEKSPQKLGRLNLAKLYQIIQTSEEAIKRTEILLHREKRETTRMILPYLRLSPENILKLKEKINESFERILKLKSRKSA